MPDDRPLWYFINERYQIRLNRYAGKPWPWTDDPILQSYSFCEVFRADDRVSRWLIDNWYRPNQNHPHLWFSTLIARQINWPDTLEECGFPYDPYDWRYYRDVMRSRQLRNLKVYTGAYMIYGGPGKTDKPTWTCGDVLQAPWEHRETIERYFRETPPDERRLEWVVNWLSHFRGWSGFMSYEAACDMAYTPLLNRAADLNTWANPGPGAYRGLNRLLDRPLNSKPPIKQAIREMRELWKIAHGPQSPIGPHVPRPFNLREIEGGLCETDKYLRVRNGEGKPRSKFIPPHLRPVVGSRKVPA